MKTTGLMITTKFHGPTNYKGSRVIATCKAPSGTVRVTLSWDHGLDSTENHRTAAAVCADRLSQRNEYYDYTITAHAWDDTDRYYFIAEAGEKVVEKVLKTIAAELGVV